MIGLKRKKNHVEQVIKISGGEETETTFFQDGSRDIFQLLAPSAVRYSSEHELQVENNYVRTFVLNGYPSRVTFGWLDQLYNYNGDMDVAVYIEPYELRSAVDELTSKITQYTAQLMIEQENGSIKNVDNLSSKINSLYEQRAKLEQNYENMFHVATFCSMYNSDLRQLNKDAQMFQSLVSGAKKSIMPLTLRQDDGFRTVAPFGKNRIPDYYRNMNTDALSTMNPFYNAEVSHMDGTLIGINELTGTPTIINFFNRKLLGNANLLVFGKSGAGKTYLVSLITLRSAIEGVRSVILDPENEYGKVTEALNGITINIAPGENMINIFDIDSEVIVDQDGNSNGVTVDIKGKVASLLNIFSVWFPDEFSDSVFFADVSKVLLSLYDDFGITTNPESLYQTENYFDEETEQYVNRKVQKVVPKMSDFKAKLEQQTDNKQLMRFANTLAPYTSGGIYDMFDCYTNIDMQYFNEAILIRFVLQSVEDEVLRPVIMYIVADWCWNKFIKRDLWTKKRLVCDEAWMMLQKSMKASDYTSLFLEKCARRIRKYNGSLCCASQNFREFVSRDEGQAVLSSSAVKMFMKQDENDILDVTNRFILSDGERQRLLTAKRGEVLMKIGTESFVVRVLSFPFENSLISKEYLKEDEDETAGYGDE